MGIFDHALGDAIKIQARIIEFLVLENNHLSKEVLECKKYKPHKIHAVLTTIINQSKFIIMAITLDSSQKVTGVLTLIDDVTLQQVPATYTGATAISDNETVATATIDADGNNLVITAIGAGTANVSVNAIAAFNNSLGVASSGAVNATVAVTVVAVQTADGVHLEIVLGAPQPK